MAYSLSDRFILKLSEKLPMYLVLSIIEKRLDDLLTRKGFMRIETVAYLAEAKDHYNLMEQDIRKAGRTMIELSNEKVK
jgi:hypothetical protein